MNNRWFKFKNIKIARYGEYVLTGVSNLETGTAERRKINYIDTDGSSYDDIWYNERPFEISGMIYALDEKTMVRLKRKLIQACSLKESFRLKYFNREKTYSAECYFDKLPTFEKRQEWYLPFKLYLTIPGFYWQSEYESKLSLFEYEDNVTDTFTLPCVFTDVKNQMRILNSGDVETYPTFIVKHENDVEDGRIIVINETSGKTITLNYKTSSGETITIDTSQQTAMSNINGNITGNVDINTDFFCLLKGINDIKCISPGNTVAIRFYKNYLGV